MIMFTLILIHILMDHRKPGDKYRNGFLVLNIFIEETNVLMVCIHGNYWYMSIHDFQINIEIK